MFALEIDFNDGVSSPETLLIKRVRASIGAGTQSHVVIEGSTANLTEIEIGRDLAAKFYCRSLNLNSSGPRIDGDFEASAELNLGEVSVTVTSLDVDLAIREDEGLDEAGLRVIKQALSSNAPIYPAVALLGPKPVVLSFQRESSVVVGRGANANLRVDSADVSSQHARIGFENGSFWVEDLGSTNGTFVDEERVSGRVDLSGQVVRLGLETMLVGVNTAEDLTALSVDNSFSDVEQESPVDSYPCFIALNESVKPEKFVLPKGETISMGRDPANNIWLGASHISRNHLNAMLTPEGQIVLEDLSSNGTFLDGNRIPSGEPYILESQSGILGFGGEIELAICYSKLDEAQFLGQKPEDPASKHPEPFVSQTGPVPEVGEIASGVFARMVAERNIELEQSQAEHETAMYSSISDPGSAAAVEDALADKKEVSDVGGEIFGEDPDSATFSQYRPHKTLTSKILVMGSMLVVLGIAIILFFWFVSSSV